MYESGSDPYVYPGTHILKNQFGMRNAKRLAKLERQLTAARAREGIPQGGLDRTHYLSIHRHLFQDVYDWAGELRTVDLAKGGSMFCRAAFVDRELTKLFAELRAAHHYRNRDFGAAAKGIAHFMIELNAVHPFREGNGRTQHVFLGLLLECAGHPRDLSKIDPNALLQAAIDGFNGDEEPMRRAISSLPPLTEP